MIMDVALPDRVGESELHRFTNMQLLPWLKKLKKLAGSLKLPIGSIYISVTDDNPEDTLGYGTWVEVAKGKVLVGLDDTDADFDELRETGGSKTHTHTTVSHTHGMDHNHTATHFHTTVSHYHTVNSHSHQAGLHTHSTPVHEHETPFLFYGDKIYLKSGYGTGSSYTFIAWWQGTTVTPGVSYSALKTDLSGSGTTGTGYGSTGNASPDTNTAAPNTGITNVITGPPSPSAYTAGSVVTVNSESSLQPYYVVRLWERVS
jgi:hypothetical protein